MVSPDLLRIAEGGADSAGDAAAIRPALARLFGPPSRREFAVRLWDGSVEPAGSGSGRRFTLVLRHPGALRRLLIPPSELRAAEAFINGDVDVEGDLEAATVLGDQLLRRLASPLEAARVLLPLVALPMTTALSRQSRRRYIPRPSTRLHTRAGDRAAVRFHYDVGNDFYRLWLDRGMTYSCAYFPTGREDLDTAQAAKLDYLCRKLRLARGERLLDIGCGWGGLVLHAARRYGVEAVGITLSQPQADWARNAIAASGLQDRCRILVQDYRDLPAGDSFDKIASVGMVEHVGCRNLGRYFEQAFRLLRPGGLFLNHGIADLRPSLPSSRPARVARLFWRPGRFIERHIFPGGTLVLPSRTVAAAEAAGFETRDVESLREHYALTLRAWLRRLEAHGGEAIALVGERTYRTWRLYLAGSARQFAAGRLGLLQVLLAKRDRGRVGLPLSRADLYTFLPGGRGS